MMAEAESPRDGGDPASFKRVSSWASYRELLAYPLDILDTPDPYELMLRACESDKAVLDWKSRMIGSKTFDGKLFIDAMQSYL